MHSKKAKDNGTQKREEEEMDLNCRSKEAKLLRREGAKLEEWRKDLLSRKRKGKMERTSISCQISARGRKEPI